MCCLFICAMMVVAGRLADCDGNVAGRAALRLLGQPCSLQCPAPAHQSVCFWTSVDTLTPCSEAVGQASQTLVRLGLAEGMDFDRFAFRVSRCPINACAAVCAMWRGLGRATMAVLSLRARWAGSKSCATSTPQDTQRHHHRRRRACVCLRCESYAHHR
jgi:hypothetical protein